MAVGATAVATEKSDHGSVVKSNQDFHIAPVSVARHERFTGTYSELMDQMQT